MEHGVLLREQAVASKEQAVASKEHAVAVQERSVQSAQAKLRRLAVLEKQTEQMRAQIDAHRTVLSRERLMTLQIMQGLAVQNFTLSCGINKATDLSRAMWRTSHLIYNMRNAMYRMFSPIEYDGIAFPHPVKPGQSDAPKDFGEFGRQELAAEAKRFLETFGPFSSEEECSYMCGWRHNETLLDYVQRINGYVMLKMSSGWRDSDERVRERKDSDLVYVASRSGVLQRKLTEGQLGGLQIRLEKECSNDLEELEAQAIKRVFGQEDKLEAMRDPFMWMF